MKNKIIKVIIFLILVIITFCFLGDKREFEENNKPKEIKTNLLTMNLEQTAGAGDYKTVTQSEWPTEGYKFNSELSRCENGSELSWDDENKIVLMSGISNDKCYVYFDKVITLANYVIAKYNGVQGNNNIYYHNSSLENGAGDNSYRYSGASDDVNNYVCFGSDATPCPEDNLYRIIGVFDGKVKLIKATIANSNLLGTDGVYNATPPYYNWTTSTTCPNSLAFEYNNGIARLANKNIVAAGTVDSETYCVKWQYSKLNTINLNTNFINNIGTTWASKIAVSTWKVGNVIRDEIENGVPSVVYNKEINNTNDTTTYDAKIGLHYLSDYGFAASPSVWETIMSSFGSHSTSNWLISTNSEWSITHTDTKAFESGTSISCIEPSNHRYIRPAFYLDSTILYVSGNGTKSSPIRIN